MLRVNNLNFLRLIFASLVVLSHSPELVEDTARVSLRPNSGGPCLLGKSALTHSLWSAVI